MAPPARSRVEGRSCHGRDVPTTDQAVADRRWWRHNGAMPSVQIKDAPAETHAVLRPHPPLPHQPPQAHHPAKLIEEASTPALDEVLDRVGGRAGGSLSFRDAVEAVHDDRDRRS